MNLDVGKQFVKRSVSVGIRNREYLFLQRTSGNTTSEIELKEIGADASFVEERLRENIISNPIDCYILVVTAADQG